MAGILNGRLGWFGVLAAVRGRSGQVCGVEVSGADFAALGSDNHSIAVSSFGFSGRFDDFAVNHRCRFDGFGVDFQE